MIAGRNPTLAVEWKSENPAQLDGPFTGGALAGGPLDAKSSAVPSTQSNSGYDGARLVRMLADGSGIETSSEIATNWAGGAALDVVDYDNDGIDEAFLATSSLYDGWWGVYNFFAGNLEWSSGSVRNQATGIDITHADLTGDGRAELVGMNSSGVITVHDVYQQTLVWQSTTLGNGRRVFVTDVEGGSGGFRSWRLPRTMFTYIGETPSLFRTFKRRRITPTAKSSTRRLATRTATVKSKSSFS